MRTLKVKVNDTIFDKVIAFFNKLPQKDVKVSFEDTDDKLQTPKKLTSLSIKTKGYKFNRQEANER